MRCDDAHMTLRLFRPFAITIAVLALALPAVGGAATADLTTDRGVVQSVGAGQIVLRALDGSAESFTVSPVTRVKLNGVRRRSLTSGRASWRRSSTTAAPPQC